MELDPGDFAEAEDSLDTICFCLSESSRVERGQGGCGTALINYNRNVINAVCEAE